jgi:hypothetical protein
MALAIGAMYRHSADKQADVAETVVCLFDWTTPGYRVGEPRFLPDREAS